MGLRLEKGGMGLRLEKGGMGLTLRGGHAICSAEVGGTLSSSISMKLPLSNPGSSAGGLPCA